MTITMTTFLNEFLGILNAMSPYLLLGFLFSGLLNVFVPKALFRNHLAKNDVKSVFWAAMIGIPLPLCSCGVIPTAMSLKKEGASNGAAVSFLIATPQTGVDSILATYGLMGLPYAIVRPLFALILAMFGGVIVNKWGKASEYNGATEVKQCTDCCSPSGKKEPLKDIFRYGFVSMIQDFGQWLVIGLVIAASITAFIPSDFFELFSQNYVLNILAILAISVPMYVCATGSIPIALSLVAMGISPGAAFVFLIAGPATNVASITVLRKVLGARTTFLYVLSVVVGSILCAMFVDLVLPPEWFSSVVAHADGCCHGVESAAWWEIACSVIFVLLFINAYVQKHFAKRHDLHTPAASRIVYRVSGMRCNHCKANVEKNFASHPSVSHVLADPQSNTLEIEGDICEDEVRKTIEEMGFEFGGRC